MFHVKLLLVIILFFPLANYAQHFGTTKLEVKELPPSPIKINDIVQYLDKFPEGTTLTSNQRDWFYWTNYSRSNPKRFWDSVVSPILQVYPNFRNSYTESLKKDLYTAPSLPLVKPNNDLYKTAERLAKELALKKAPPSHTSPSGETFEQRMQSINIRKCGGENISFGPSNTTLMLVLLYIDEGVPDLGHRKSLLNPAFEEMGIGIEAYPDNKFIVVQDFACSQKE